MLTRDELEGKLEAFRSEMRREMRDKSEDAFEKFRDEMLREHEKDRVKTPAEEARKRRRNSIEYEESSGDQDIEWGFREGVRWFKNRVIEHGEWSETSHSVFLSIEEKGTA